LLTERPIRSDADIPRNGKFICPQRLGERRSNRRITDRTHWRMTGPHQVCAARMIALPRTQPADDRQLVRLGREPWQMLAEPHPRHIRLDFPELASILMTGLHVEGVGLR